MSFDKITARIANLCGGLVGVDPVLVAQDTIVGLYEGMRTEDIDTNSALAAESLKTRMPDYAVLAGRILASNLHKKTPNSFSACMQKIQDVTGTVLKSGMEFVAANAAALDAMIIHANDYNYDYFGFKTLEYSYLKKIPEYIRGPDGRPTFADADGGVYGFDQVVAEKTHGFFATTPAGERIPVRERSIDVAYDRPQYMYMRVAIIINMHRPNPLVRIQQCYNNMSARMYTHATPTLFNSMDVVQQLNSCFLLGTADSIEGIHKTLNDCGLISKCAGGIGVWQHPIRPAGSLIKSTRGKSTGLPKQLNCYNDSAVCWDQGGGKRKGAYAMYIEPWHGDVREFLEMKLPHGDGDRARDLFYALWVPDLFVRRAINGENWSLFGEHTAPGLSDVYDGMYVCKKCGECENPSYSKYVHSQMDETFFQLTPELFEQKIAQIASRARVDHPAPTAAAAPCAHEYEQRDVFTNLYTHYERMGLAVDVVPARMILNMMFTMQRESGTPYVCFKDHVNRMSNQRNIGTIKSSNLCAEIMEYSSATSYASCTLASINLPRFLVPDGNGKLMFDFELLRKIVAEIVESLDNVIDVTIFPVPECEQNARDYRPIGIGIQGLADLFAILRIPFASDVAARLDLEIAETIYYSAVEASHELSKTRGSYAAFAGSPASQGILHPDLWMQNQKYFGGVFAGIDPRTGRYDFAELARRVRGGLRNSLLIANMPTVSTTQIFGNNDSFEPFPFNIYTKAALSGKFTVANMHMIRHLCELRLWSKELYMKIGTTDGSIQSFSEIPEDVRDIYKTSWEIPQQTLISRAALRGAFVDQSQSLNIRLHDNSNKYLRAVFVHGWKCGHKTGSYYIRTKPAASAMKTTVAEMAAAVMPEYRPDDKINVTVERVSVDGGVLAHTEHTFHLLLPFCADDDDDDDELCTAIVPGEIFVREIAAAPPTQSRYSQFQRFEDTPRFKMADGDGCLACGS